MKPRSSRIRRIALPVLVLAAAAFAQTAAGRRYEEIRARHARGEKVTADEREFASRTIERRNQEAAAKRFADYAKEHPPHDSLGLAPLPDLGQGEYKGEQGGLYPGGPNTPPAEHLKAGLKLAREIVPLDESGAKSSTGKIVLLSIGMSNTTQEFRSLQELAAKQTDLNPRLLLVDGAQGGQAADTTAKPGAKFWDIVNARLREAGAGAKQVQAVWLKQAVIAPKRDFPAEAKLLEAYLVDTLHNLHDKFPNLKIVYFSSRTYAGYAGTPLNPEPHSYESAFSVKWVIGRQLRGDAALNYDPARGAVRSPWLAWGPYIWADGMKGRKDGFVWMREDSGPDGTHPSMSGREKVAKLLLDFLKRDPTSRGWVVKQ